MGLREPFNSISHIVGGGLSIVGMPFLFMAALPNGDAAVVAVAVYGISLVTMYTLSVVYHSLRLRRPGEAWLRRLDQVGIYLLIAGTYTPVALVQVGGVGGWALFAFEWAAAATGIVLLLAVHRAHPGIHQAAYIVLGWAGVVALPSLLEVGLAGLALLVLGGISYTAGAALFLRNRARILGPFGDHEVWHVMVLVGSAAHYAFILGFVL